MSDSAYGTKVMLGSIDKLICDALQEIAPNESDYQVIGLNGSTMLHKIVLPQLIKFWTDATKIVGDPEDFENLSPEDMQQLIDNIDEMMDGEING